MGCDLKVEPETPAQPNADRAFLQLVQGELVELAGFEPAALSLRTMQSKRSDQGIRRYFEVLWRGCGTTDVRHSES